MVRVLGPRKMDFADMGLGRSGRIHACYGVPKHTQSGPDTGSPRPENSRIEKDVLNTMTHG